MKTKKQSYLSTLISSFFLVLSFMVFTPDVFAACGDGILDIGEQCDDGNTDNYDGCTSTCQNEVCTDIGTVMVKDINTGIGSTNFEYLANMNGTLYFSANDGVNGYELWKSDGTTAGTEMVKDINTGIAGSYPSHLTNVNNTLYFAANDGVNGNELWKSDGTTEGTVKVKDINASGNSSPSYLLNFNDTLYFAANDGINGNELWKSDGTEAGTEIVKDINAIGNSFPSYLTNVNGTLYFSANNDGVNGNELWKSDGTTEGTVKVKDFWSGIGSPNPKLFTDINGTLYFSVTYAFNEYELWKSDGTEAGTEMVKDNWSGSGNYSITDFINFNGTLYFAANDGINGKELWKSDGTTAGTVMVKDIYPGGDSDLSDLINVNGTLFFAANDGSHEYELWKSDGSEVGTMMVKDVVAIGTNYPYYFTNINGILYFVYNDGVSGYELWKSDGTEAGTMMVEDINPSGDSNPDFLTNVNGTLYFAANDGSNGIELWKTDFIFTSPICGNGVFPEAGEECDDGNTDNGDGCSSTCTIEGGGGGGGGVPADEISCVLISPTLGIADQKDQLEFDCTTSAEALASTDKIVIGVNNAFDDFDTLSPILEPDPDWDISFSGVTNCSLDHDVDNGETVILDTTGTNSITYTLGTDDTCDTGGTFKVIIGGVTNQLTFPSQQGQYSLSVTTTDNDNTVLESGYALLNVGNQLTLNVHVAEAINMSIDNTLINLLVDPSVNDGRDFSQKNTITVQTNALSGYAIQAKLEDSQGGANLRNGDDLIPSQNIMLADIGFGYVSYNESNSKTQQNILDEFLEAGKTCMAFDNADQPLTQSNGVDEIGYTSVTNGFIHTIYYLLDVDYLVKAGDYTGTITYTVVPRF